VDAVAGGVARAQEFLVGGASEAAAGGQKRSLLDISLWALRLGCLNGCDCAGSRLRRPSGLERLNLSADRRGDGPTPNSVMKRAHPAIAIAGRNSETLTGFHYRFGKSGGGQPWTASLKATRKMAISPLA